MSLLECPKFDSKSMLIVSTQSANFDLGISDPQLT